MINLDHLDDDQRHAACAPDGVVRVMSGAGTGKTTTLQSRIAFILDEDLARPYEVMAVTFTNKAAAEIRERVGAAIGEAADNVRMGTFHSLSLRILRKYAEAAGLKSSSFTILDDDEVKQLFSQAIDESGVLGDINPEPKTAEMTTAAYKAYVKELQSDHDARRRIFEKECREQVLRWKECGLHISEALSKEDLQVGEKEFVQVYKAYQDILDRKNMCDFADLILRVVHLFENYPDVARAESKKIRYLLVDEFQDTNMMQYRWLQHLYQYHGNLFVVGDLDQSLYSFRGSAPLIMDRMSEIADTDVLLKMNRRCTQEILNPANNLVDINARQAPKELVSEKRGQPVQVLQMPNEHAETNAIVSKIQELRQQGVDLEEISIIARSAFIIKPFEKALLRAGVPYALMARDSLLDREEVKDIMAFAKLAIDPYNDIAFRRIANKPSKGLGPAALNTIVEAAQQNDVALHEACQLVASGAVKGAARKNILSEISNLGGTLAALAMACEMDSSPREIIEMAINESRYMDYVEKSWPGEEGVSRIENLDFLQSYCGDFPNIVEFVQEFALVSDAIEAGEGVRLCSIHASKGLEFDYVFLPGWEEGVFPSSRSIEEIPGDVDNPWVGPPIGGVEEERRIAHVALTRAKQAAFISMAKVRNLRATRPSRFLQESGLSAHRANNRAAGYGSEEFDNSNDPGFGGIKFPNAGKLKARRKIGSKFGQKRAKQNSNEGTDGPSMTM